jgi:hypothetical protein
MAISCAPVHLLYVSQFQCARASADNFQL